MRLVAPFTVTGWEAAPLEPAHPDAPSVQRVIVQKRFEGALVGTAVAELLMHGVVPGDLAAGAVYVAIDRITGTLDGRAGAFTLQHGGIGGPGVTPFTYGYILPGSGTEALAGMQGTAEIAAGPDGHTLTLDYTLPQAPGEEAPAP